MKVLLGDYWRTGYCARNVDVRSGALAVAVVTFVASAALLSGTNATHGILALIGVIASSLAFYAYYKHVAWAYLPLLVLHEFGYILNAMGALLSAVLFFFSFSGVVRIASAILVVVFSLLAVFSYWFVRILYGAYRWQKERDAQTHQAHPGRVAYDGSVLVGGTTATAPLYP